VRWAIQQMAAGIKKAVGSPTQWRTGYAIWRQGFEIVLGRLTWLPLAARLQAKPDDVDGWLKLIRSRVVLNDTVRAKDDLGMARKTFATQPAKLAQINALAKELGL
ncbi:MAG: hypothetical protein ABMA01_23515, partial [Chthoniobacteraceae bacterium]